MKRQEKKNKIKIDNLSFSYTNSPDTQVINKLNTNIDEGEFVCILGQSGCGKSTLLNILAGLLPYSCGQVLINGEPVTGPSTNKSIVFQHHALFPWLTAKKNIIFGIKQSNPDLSKTETEELADIHLEKVELTGAANKYPSELSGGMQQRVAIARAFAMDCDVMLLDEPFGSLDPRIRNKLQEKLAELWENQTPKKTIVFVTHDIEESIMLSDKILFMANGGIYKEVSINMTRPRKHRDIMQLPECCSTRKSLIEMFYESQEQERVKDRERVVV